MKKFLAASLAAFLLFTAAACTRQSSPQQTPEPAQPVTQEPAAQPEVPAQEPAEPIRITPNQQGSATPSDAAWLDEPDTIQTDLEEIVTCTYKASAAANAVFDTLSQTVLSYAQETVYPTAQEKQAIGYVNGGYSISEVDGTLVVDYTLSVSYSTETSDQQFTHIYTIDLSTGELLKEE